MGCTAKIRKKKGNNWELLEKGDNAQPRRTSDLTTGYPERGVLRKREREKINHGVQMRGEGNSRPFCRQVGGWGSRYVFVLSFVAVVVVERWLSGGRLTGIYIFPDILAMTHQRPTKKRVSPIEGSVLIKSS